MVNVVLISGEANSADANGIELTLYEGPESPDIRLLRDGVGMPGGELRYKLADVERLVVSPDVNVEEVAKFISVEVVGATHQSQEPG